MISAAPTDEDVLGDEQLPVEVQLGHELIPGSVRHGVR